MATINLELVKEICRPGSSVICNLIILNNRIPAWWKHAVRRAQTVMVADGGANELIKRPEFAECAYADKLVAIGDMDSISQDTMALLEKLNIKIEIDHDQDTSDCEKALNYIRRTNSPLPILILGATGRRIDHELYCFRLLQRYDQRIFIVDEQNIIFYEKSGEDTRVKCFPGTNTVGIFPENNNSVKTTGLKWDFDGVVDSVSNQVEGSEFTIRTKGATVVVTCVLDKVE